ncbi:alpha/beta fold hydrolase [Streptomyces roseolilacinus]|uniref:Alpha/beta hydrolase n=1 Tax=Streptomyces roseolilacinus TaxID=66904 RepID=A0A918AXG7_9ACTN|nr:alpha/beta hydrolase [Streptomyces roseolilacinus]GGP97699.1 alpha/beta hydrolase [Streptomyces roseolilacinus]
MGTEGPMVPGTGLAPVAGRPGIWAAGPDEGAPLVLVHGIRVSARMWDPHTRRLTPRFRITAPDLAGHGTQRDRPFSLEEAVAQVGLAVEEAALATGRPPLVVGASLGGYVALAYGAAHPDHAAAVLVQGSTARPDSLTGRVYRTAARAIWGLGPARAARLNDRALKRRLPRESYEAVMGGGLTMHAFVEVVEDLTRRDFLTVAGRARLPVLFVNGRGDRLFRAHEREFVDAVRSGGGYSRLFHVNGPHDMSISDPAAFTRIVERGHALLSEARPEAFSPRGERT